MKNRKAFTLVEVIVSLGVLGIISLSFLGAISNHFRYLNQTKNITEDVFSIQRNMEEEIDDIKEKIRNNELPLKEKTIFTSLGGGGIKVKYYEVDKSVDSRNYFTLVSNIRPDPLELVELESLSSQLVQGNNEVNYGYGTYQFSMIGSFKNLELYKWDHLLNQSEWYVSSKEYNMPMPKDPNFNITDDIVYNSYYFPLFPRDYVIVENETVYKFGSSDVNFNFLSDYAGRHVIFATTPAAKSGKLGIQKVSDPIFISGLPVTDNLITHLDASYIDIIDTNEVQNNSGQLLVNKWIDLSSIIGRTTPNQAATTVQDAQPIVYRTDMGSGFIGQYIQFTNGKYLTINENINGKTLHIFAVVQNRSDTEETRFLRNGTNNLNISPNNTENHYEWTISEDAFISNSNNIFFEGSHSNIAEIIIYDGILDESSADLVEEYLLEKYKQPIILGDIVSLRDMSTSIQKGNNIVLPSMVLADMSRGATKYVSVSWSGDFDINTAGTYEIVGSAIADSNKKMIYTIIVNE